MSYRIQIRQRCWHNWVACSQRDEGWRPPLASVSRSSSAPDVDRRRVRTRPRNRQTPSRGGELLVSIRTEPRSFNRHAARDTSTDLVSTLTHARLVRIDQATQDVEPWLAEGWTRRRRRAARTMTLKRGRGLLRRPAVHGRRCGVCVSGGVRRAERQHAGGFPEGRRKKLQVAALDPAHGGDHLPGAVCARPAHPRQPADSAAPSARGGARGAAASRRPGALDTPPSDLVGLGPFVLRRVRAGATARLRAQPALLRRGRPTARRCRTSIGSSSTSSPIRARSCCGWSRGSST